MAGILLTKTLVDSVYDKFAVQFNHGLHKTTRTLCVEEVVRMHILHYYQNGCKDFSNLKIYYPKQPVDGDAFTLESAELRAKLEKNGTIANLGRFIDGLLFYWLSGKYDGLVAPMLVRPTVKPRPFIAPEVVRQDVSPIDLKGLE